MEDNIRRVQAPAREDGLGNRPHIKTHKIPAIGRLQMAAGAIGITCQKLGEVEVFIDAGVADDVLVTYNILGRGQAERLMALARACARSWWCSTTRRWRAGSPRRRRTTAGTSASSSSATRAWGGPACRRRRRRFDAGARRPCGCRAFSSAGS